MLEMAQEQKEEYANSTKSRKRIIVEQTIQRIENLEGENYQPKFLRRSKDKRYYEEVSWEKKYEKVAHCFRERKTKELKERPKKATCGIVLVPPPAAEDDHDARHDPSPPRGVGASSNTKRVTTLRGQRRRAVAGRAGGSSSRRGPVRNTKTATLQKKAAAGNSAERPASNLPSIVGSKMKTKTGTKAKKITAPPSTFLAPVLTVLPDSTAVDPVFPEVDETMVGIIPNRYDLDDANQDMIGVTKNHQQISLPATAEEVKDTRKETNSTMTFFLHHPLDGHLPDDDVETSKFLEYVFPTTPGTNQQQQQQQEKKKNRALPQMDLLLQTQQQQLEGEDELQQQQQKQQEKEKSHPPPPAVFCGGLPNAKRNDVQQGPFFHGNNNDLVSAMGTSVLHLVLRPEEQDFLESITSVPLDHDDDDHDDVVMAKTMRGILQPFDHYDTESSSHFNHCLTDRQTTSIKSDFPSTTSGITTSEEDHDHDRRRLEDLWLHLDYFAEL